jgi:putative sterol carrier protein
MAIVILTPEKNTCRRKAADSVTTKERLMASAAELFERMPEFFDAQKAGDLNATVLFDLSGEGGGKWHVKVMDGVCTTGEGAVEAPTATIRMDATDYADMVAGRLNAMEAFMQQKIRVEGDLSTVMKFQTLFG